MTAWLKEDLANGNITPEQAVKAFDALGASPEATRYDTWSDEVKQLDEQFPLAKPQDFLIRYGLPGQALQMTDELNAFDTTARTWLSGAELPRELGNTLVNTISKVPKPAQCMTPAQLADYGYAEVGKLQRA